MTARDLIARPFGRYDELIAAHARERPQATALVEGARAVSFATLDAMVDRVAATLQREGLKPRQAVAVCAATSLEYAAVFIGILRAGGAVAPLPPSATPDTIADMVADAGADLLFLDTAAAADLAPVAGRIAVRRVALDESGAATPLSQWLLPPGSRPRPVANDPDDPFNLIYSSGTTGTPKGIVQPQRMRWFHVQRARDHGYAPESTTLIATPLYSNTTLVSFLPALGIGGCVVLMPKFDAGEYLRLAEKHRASHTMLVPVQYRRIMAHPRFGDFDLSAFRMKFCTSAPFAAGLKADILRRWPGGLIEYYGMTEGGGTVILKAHEHPHKLATVGQPAPSSDIRLVDESGREVPHGEAGEVVGHSPAMMSGYHGRPAPTREAEWHSPDGRRFIRTGDIGRFDGDGFLTLLDRKKDMIISGGFNIYPSDIEAVLVGHPAVAEAAVVGVASTRWGETPVAFVVARDPDGTLRAVVGDTARADAEALREWANARLGKTQRLAALRIVDALPRSAIGKVLKRELRDAFVPPPDF